MATTPTDSTLTFEDLIGEVIPLFAECGLFPTDDLEQIAHDLDLLVAPAWLPERHEAFLPHRLGFIAANSIDDELNLLVLTQSGVTISHARFDITEVGFLMFAGAVDALNEDA